MLLSFEFEAIPESRMSRPWHQRAAISAVRIARPVQKLWWRATAKTVVGVSGMVVDRDGRVLLVRHTYMRGWHFPGGGVGRRETLRDALSRELREEVGVAARAEPQLVGAFTNLADPRSSHVVLFRIADFDMAFVPNLEIEEWRFFDPDPDLPGLGRGPRNRFSEAAGRRAPDGLW